MTEPIEQRLLRLAEAATADKSCWYSAQQFSGMLLRRLTTKRSQHLGVEPTAVAADANLLAALDPATVSRLARVVEAARLSLPHFQIVPVSVADSVEAHSARRELISALASIDNDREETA